MKLPTNASKLQHFLGMINQLGKFSSNLEDLNLSLAELLNTKSTWLWGTAQDQAFSNFKEEVSNTTVTVFCDPQTSTKVCTGG